MFKMTTPPPLPPGTDADSTPPNMPSPPPLPGKVGSKNEPYGIAEQKGELAFSVSRPCSTVGRQPDAAPPCAAPRLGTDALGAPGPRAEAKPRPLTEMEDALLISIDEAFIDTTEAVTDVLPRSRTLPDTCKDSLSVALTVDTPIQLRLWSVTEVSP